MAHASGSGLDDMPAEAQRGEVLHPHRRGQENGNGERRLDPHRVGVARRSLARQRANDRLRQVDQAAQILGVVELAQPGAVACRHARFLGIDLAANRLQRRDLLRRRLDPPFGDLDRGQRETMQLARLAIAVAVPEEAQRGLDGLGLNEVGERSDRLGITSRLDKRGRHLEETKAKVPERDRACGTAAGPAKRSPRA